jgi:thiol-disulfide isomerase/thioredoxin
MRKVVCLALIILLQTVSLRASALDVLPFTPKTLAEIKQQYQNQPFILAFWSETCTFCMKELALFGKLKKQYPDLPLVIVSTDLDLDEQSIREILQQQSQLDLEKTWVFSGDYPEVIYRAVDKRWRGELPMTYFFDRQHQPVRHVGLVKEQELLAWLAFQVEHQ